MIEDFTNEYQIPFQWGPLVNVRLSSNYVVDTIDEDDPHYLLSCAPFIIGEFRKYPAEFIKGSGLSRMVFARNISDPKANIVVYGMAILTDLTMLLNAKEMRWNDDVSSSILHHEFFHILDQGDIQREYLAQSNVNVAKLAAAPNSASLGMRLFAMRRPEMITWQKLNPPDFKYKNTTALLPQNESWHTMDHPTPGFATLYQMVNVMEDRAELFGSMRVASHYKQIMGFAEEDTFLSNKIEHLKGYLLKRHPSMDERFWKGFIKDQGEP